MKKAIGLLLLLLSMQQARSQVLMNLQLPFSGVYVKSQLWNFSIINAGAQAMTVKIEMTFSDVSNGQLVFTATSNTFTLTQETATLQASDLTPIVYNVVNGSYNVDTDPNGFLPVGNFEVCFAVMKIDAETTEQLVDACEQLEVEPISPPLLIEPADEETIDYPRPFFTWLPPSPSFNFNNLVYDWVLVEVQDNQHPSDAIDQNISVHSEQNLVTNSFLYPASLPELDSSKLYAWQVSAKSSNNAISKTEIWTFRIRLYGLDTLYANTNAFYSPLKKEKDAAYITVTDKLRFEYLNEVKDTLAFFNIYDISTASGNLVNSNPIPISLRYGQNFLSKEINGINGMTDRHIYLLELINNKNEKWYLKFEYREPENN